VGLLAPEPPANVRCSDADRERTVAVLRNEAVVGRLSTDELSTRLDKAFAAKTMGDLRALIADLPEGNINPWSEMISGAVQTSVTAFRVGLVVAGGAALIGVFTPVIAGLALTGHGTAALAVVGVLVFLVFAIALRVKRRAVRRLTP
jgi:VIT1/CCC1 family predicted Fe2+/Mn2+ transporter